MPDNDRRAAGDMNNSNMGRARCMCDRSVRDRAACVTVDMAVVEMKMEGDETAERESDRWSEI